MKLELTPALRYWEMNSRELLSRLEELRQKNCTVVGAWIPWAHLEQDRHSQLQKFCKQAMQMGMKIRLGVCPELNTGYVNAGIPLDLLEDRQNLAQDRTGQYIFSCAPPAIHPLISLSAPKVVQKFGHYLLKLSHDLTEVLNEGFNGQIELLVTDSLYKHYYTAGLAPEDHGDYSGRYSVGNGNRQFALSLSQAENHFINRCYDFLKTKFAKTSIQVQRKNIFSRGVSLDRLMQELMSSAPDCKQEFQQIIKSSSMNQAVWLDDLSAVPKKEKYFIISASLILQQDLWMNADDYLSCAPGISKKLSQWISNLSQDEISLSAPVSVLVQNRFAPARISACIKEKMKSAVHFSSTKIPELEETAGLKLLVVEEGLSLDLIHFQDLEKLARAKNITIALFRSSLCKQAEKRVSEIRSFQLNNSWRYDVSIFPSGGHLLVVDTKENITAPMDSLCESLISAADIKPWCECTANQVLSLSYEWNEHSKILFLINCSDQEQEVNLKFLHNVQIQKVSGKEFDTKLLPYSVVPVSMLVEKEDAPCLENNYPEEKINGTEAFLA